MVGYIVIGSIGLGLVLISLILGEIFDSVFEAFDLDGGGIFSTPVIGAFLAAFGFGAALIIYTTKTGPGLSALGGLASGMVMGGVALFMTRTLMNMPTDDPVRSSGLLGRPATVVTRIPADGYGEISVTYAGQYMKVSARAPEPIPAGVKVVVTDVTSASSVVVKRDDAS
ncbi:MAG TPA: NfeD family protein [Frankiaceae bacterium]|nr:NfeD family protein [Frankiaceae bacterium]